MYGKGASSFDDMTDLSKAFRLKLADLAELETLRLVRETDSSMTGTRKFQWECGDGAQIGGAREWWRCRLLHVWSMALLTSRY